MCIRDSAAMTEAQSSPEEVSAAAYLPEKIAARISVDYVSGAGATEVSALAAALEVGAREDMAGKVIVTFLPDFADRYLSTALFDGLG